MFFNLLDMALYNSFMLYSKNTEKTLSQNKFMEEILMDVVKEGVAPSEEAKHELVHLPGRKVWICPVGEKNSVYALLRMQLQVTP